MNVIMRRNALIKLNGTAAGILAEENRNKYSFTYLPDFLSNKKSKAVSISLPLRKEKFTSEFLFPFFVSLLAEGSNLSLQSRQLKIDKLDFFGLLLKTASSNTIGNVTVHEISGNESEL